METQSIIPSDLKNILYDKTYTCPICNHTFVSQTVRMGKNRLVSSDIDLRSHYSLVDPILYDAILCTCCGYAAFSKNFVDVLPKQVEWIKSGICEKYRSPSTMPTNIQALALFKHKMALLTGVTKHGKIGEQAYVCLHIGWLYDDLGDPIHEFLFLNRAIKGFEHALESERFPIFNLDEITCMYIIGALYYKLNDFTDSKKALSRVLSSNPSIRIKNRVLDLKELVNNQVPYSKVNVTS